MNGSDQSIAQSCQLTVPVEIVDYLRDFMTQVNTQDNRATASPYYYELHYNDEENGVHDGLVRYGRTIFFTEKAAEQYLKDNAHNLPKDVYSYIQWGGRNPELRRLLEAIGEVVGIPYERK